MANHTCDVLGCHRSFVSEKAYSDHAAVVHFSEIRTLVESAVRETYGESYVVDMTSDYVVFEFWEDGKGYQLFQAPYSVSDTNEVTIGDLVAVLRVVTYEPKPNVDAPGQNSDGHL